MDKEDIELATAEFTEWFRKLMAEDSINFADIPYLAFIAGAEWASRLQWE